MSHVTDVKMKVRSLDMLEEACEHLGLELRRGQKTYAWWGSYLGDSRDYGEHQPKDMGKCEHAIRIKGDQPKNGSGGPWEIGVIKAADGDGYKLFYDKFGAAGQRLTEKVGQEVNHLRREYSAATSTVRARAKLVKKGWKITREDLPGNRVRLRVRKR